MDGALDGIVADDWARALAPVSPHVEAVGRFLRAEVAAGREYLPAPDAILRAFTRPLADVRVLVVGQDPYPTPGHPMGLSFSVQPDVRPVPSLARQHLPRARRRPRRAARRPAATSPRGPTRA